MQLKDVIPDYAWSLVTNVVMFKDDRIVITPCRYRRLVFEEASESGFHLRSSDGVILVMMLKDIESAYLGNDGIWRIISPAYQLGPSGFAGCLYEWNPLYKL